MIWFMSAYARQRKTAAQYGYTQASVQTMLYVVATELSRNAEERNVTMSFGKALNSAKSLLVVFARDKEWLAALSEDGAVFEMPDPEDAQLARAVERLGPASGLLTRDKNLLKTCAYAISPNLWLETSEADKGIAFIDLGVQQTHVRGQLERNMHRVLHHGKYIMGPEVQELEQRLADYVGVKHGIACSSGTDALLLSLMAYGVGPGDAIFTTPFTFIATAEVISLLGATPVFVDIDPRTFNIDPDKLKLAIKALKANDPSTYPLPNLQPQTSQARRSLQAKTAGLKPAGIIAVDLFGLPADYDAINSISEAHDLFVIEDAAQSFGAEYKGKKACSFGNIACTSFFPAKPLGCYGDGGMCFTDDDEKAEILRSLIVHGKGSHKYDNARIGINGRLDTIQAAILNAKFDIFPEEVELRQEVAQKYSKLLAPCSTLHAPCIPDGYKSVYAQYSILAKDEQHRTELKARLKDSGIPTAIYYPKPLHIQTAFESLGYKEGDFPGSEDTSKRIFSLPMHPYMTIENQEKISKILNS